jgi:hypothetical protein
VICRGKAHPEPPLALRSFGTPPGLSTATPHKGPASPYTIDDATMQPCPVDYPASRTSGKFRVTMTQAQGFSATC